MKKLLKIALILIFFSFLSAGNDGSQILLSKVKSRLERVKDYTASLLIKIDVDFLKVKDTKAVVYFKQPDKIKLESQGFAMLPKASFNFSPMNLLNRKFLSVYVRNDTSQSSVLAVVKLIPTQESSKLILATLWIDRQREVIDKLEATAKDNGSFRIVYTYGKALPYGLPDSAIFFFNLKKSGFRHFSMPGEIMEKSQRKKTKKNITGTVTVIYSDYKINSGLKDSIFKEEKEEELD